MERSQLNVVLSTELIRAVKAQARREGVSLSNFVNSCLLATIDGKSSVSLDQRVVKLEEEVNSLKNIFTSSDNSLEELSRTRTKESKRRATYSDKGATLYSKALRETFNQIGQDLMLSQDLTWGELKKQPSLKKAASIDPNYLSFCHSVLQGAHTLKGSEIENCMNIFKICPCKESLRELSGSSLDELDFVLNDAEVYPD